MVPTWEESLLADAEVKVEWLGVRDWKPGDILRDWTAKTSAVSLYLVETGTLHVVANGVTWILPAGEALVIVPGAMRECIRTPNGARWYSLGLTIQGRGRLDLAHLLGNTRSWTPPDMLHSWLQTMAACWTLEQEGGHPLIQNRLPPDTATLLIANGLAKASLGACWNTLCTTDQSQTPASTIPRWLWDTLQRIHDAPNHSLNELAEYGGVSVATMRRGFHRYLHQSPQQYLVEQRLLLANTCLETSEDNVLTIAGQVGFESLSHFTRLFAERFGETPARYRRHCRNGNV